MSETTTNPKVLSLLQGVDQLKRPGGGGLDNGGGPPHDGDMTARIAKLEDFVVDARDRLTKIETRLDQTATKADITAETSALVKWMVGTAVVLGASAITVMTFVLNNAAPKNVAAAPAPIIIQMPSTAQAVPQAPAAKSVN